MGHVLHLNLSVDDPEKAAQLARHFLRLTGAVFPELDVPFASISEEGRQSARSYLFCGEKLEDHRRCMQLPGHEHSHSAEWTRS